ncbi:MAG: glutathione S-transferase N-terminal domain-containing protein [Bauldia sp.]|nr:glutathione S-transferase N-terminal domain-containing protein [Bauldia sp.]
MKLFFNQTSPYARKVRVAAHELGIFDTLELVEADPWGDSPKFFTAAPLGKVPALVAEDGTLIVESGTICQYLDSLVPGRPLGSYQLPVLARAALAHGVVDAAFATVIERRRPREFQWTEWKARQRRAIERTLPRVAPPPAGRFDLGDLTLAVALAYLDFRLPEISWRSNQPGLGTWLDAVSTRPSMTLTAPPPGAPPPRLA